MKTSEQIDKLNEALAKAQGTIKPAVFDCVNPHYKSKYASLASTWDACRDSLAANGLSVIQGIDENEASTKVVSRLGHSSGQWIESEMTLIYEKSKGMQGIGSALSYAKRYLLSSMVGIVADTDDDAESNAADVGQGNAGQEHQGNQKKKFTPTPKKTADPVPKPLANAKDFYQFTAGRFQGKRFDEVLPEDFDAELKKYEAVEVKTTNLNKIIGVMHLFKAESKNTIDAKATQMSELDKKLGI